MGEKGDGFSGTTIKDTWTKPRGVESGGRWGWLGLGREDGGTGRKVYSNDNKIRKRQQCVL